jgi:hypothetical protein
VLALSNSGGAAPADVPVAGQEPVITRDGVPPASVSRWLPVFQSRTRRNSRSPDRNGFTTCDRGKHGKRLHYRGDAAAVE